MVVSSIGLVVENDGGGTIGELEKGGFFEVRLTLGQVESIYRE